ncbi:MAG: hypothetical protein ACJAXW_004397 [Candidatus Azotimanducaceae bacterium]|jgi:hypothetical protein
MTKRDSAIIGFLVSPFLAALPLQVILNGGFGYFLDAHAWAILLPFTYATAVIVGIPIYFLARNQFRYSALILSIFGFTIALCTSIVIFMLVVPLVPEVLWFSLRIGLCGAFGGLSFWVLTKGSHEKSSRYA